MPNYLFMTHLKRCNFTCGYDKISIAWATRVFVAELLLPAFRTVPCASLLCVYLLGEMFGLKWFLHQHNCCAKIAAQCFGRFIYFFFSFHLGFHFWCKRHLFPKTPLAMQIQLISPYISPHLFSVEFFVIYVWGFRNPNDVGLTHFPLRSYSNLSKTQ